MPTLGAVAARLKPTYAGGKGAWQERGRRGSGRRQAPLPRLWLFSDPVRLPDPAPAAAVLPRGSGVVARGVESGRLPDLARRVRQRGGVLLLGGTPRMALRLRAGLHLPDRAPPPGMAAFRLARRAGAPGALLSAAAHGAAGLRRARRQGVDLVFLSPLFATPSHPGAPFLGVWRWAALARRAACPVMALGGITATTAPRIPPQACGFGAITALLHPGHSVSMKSRGAQGEHCPPGSA
ncbi:thiamine phosphate synthase [Teichococcus rhizosphaerae]|uniref:thiamine phosphate synthase n=1 Tax=Teichococcus rhizosphaerae TaxID=1335062 RepID=UPI00159BDFCB|nr:thiamine phosphate synthase [Pseudoroseomonas rhizosphaerae]